MKVTRRAVFETNSSSTHSISISNIGALKFPTSIFMTFDDFGWEINTHYDAQTKLSYVLTGIQYRHGWQTHYPDNYWTDDVVKNSFDVLRKNAILTSKYFQWLVEMLQENSIEILDGYSSTTDDFGYIDHQSIDVLDELWSEDEATFKSNMKNFIFNSNSYLHTDNDNY